MNWTSKYIFAFFFSFLICEGASQTYVHIVTDRDNIQKLARIYGVTPLQILKINKIDPNNFKLMEHAILIIPDKTYKANKFDGRMIKTIEHRIQKGETLYTIARNYGVTVYDLLVWNPHLKRGGPLLEGEMINVIVTLNSESQYSQQIIYLNGDLFKYNLIEVKDSIEFEEVQKFNATLDDRIAEIYEITNEDIPLEDFPYPEDDSEPMVRYIYHLVKNSLDPNFDKQKWLDSFYEEVFYVNSELNDDKINADYDFINSAMNYIYNLNLANQQNDYLFGLRAGVYYWLGAYQKALIFTDEALAINPNNEQALIVRASIGQKDKHFQYSKDIFEKLHAKRPDRNFTRYNLASLHYINQNFKKAIELYSPLLEINHKYSSEINFRTGHCYVLLGNDDAGCEYLRAAEILGYDKSTALRIRYCR